MFLSIKTFIRRFLGKKLSLHRPTSWPYITGDSFRSLSNFVLDESLDFDPLLVRTGDIIFVRTNYLKEFSKKYQPLIGPAVKFILISHNEDMEVTNELVTLIDFSKCIHWFAENVQIDNPRITPIPIGLANFYSQQNGKIALFDKLNSEVSTKNSAIFYDFNIASNPEVRTTAKESIEKNPFAECRHFANQIEYYENLKTYAYMASPRGKGEDCNRTWEALYLDVQPIVIKSPMTLYFKKIGIPLYILNTWSEIEQPLDTKTATVNPKSIEALWMPYWANQIHIKRNSCFKP